MVRGDRLRRPARRREAAAVLRDLELVAEDRASGGGTQADEHLRLEQGQLGFEPRAARVELARSRRLVDPALATLLELEVLDRVGDVELLARQTRFGECPIEHLARRPDERGALEIFLVARLLADEHDARVGRAAAEHGLGRVAVEIAALATRRRRLELGEAGAGGNERRGPGGLRLGRGRCQQRVEAPDTRIARVLQQLAILVDEPPQRVVEDLPARGIGRGGGPARQVQELPRHLRAAGRRRLGGEQGLFHARRLAPAYVRRRYAVAQERARRRLPALERRLDLDRLHRTPLRSMVLAASALAVATEEAVLGPRVGVEVVGDVAHVPVHPELTKLRGGDLAQALAHVRDVRLRRRRAVEAPDHHRRLADLALGDPADVVLETPQGQLQGAAEVAVFETGELETGRGRRAHAPCPTATDAGADHCWRIWDGATRRPTAARTSTSSRRLVARVIRSFAGVLQAVAGPQCKPHDPPGGGARGELSRGATGGKGGGSATSRSSSWWRWWRSPDSC